MALIIGVILGVLVAVIRTAHDQQRAGRHRIWRVAGHLSTPSARSISPSSAAPP